MTFGKSRKKIVRTSFYFSFGLPHPMDKVP